MQSRRNSQSSSTSRESINLASIGYSILENLYRSVLAGKRGRNGWMAASENEFTGCLIVDPEYRPVSQSIPTDGEASTVLILILLNDLIQYNGEYACIYVPGIGQQFLHRIALVLRGYGLSGNSVLR